MPCIAGWRRTRPRVSLAAWPHTHSSQVRIIFRVGLTQCSAEGILIEGFLVPLSEKRVVALPWAEPPFFKGYPAPVEGFVEVQLRVDVGLGLPALLHLLAFRPSGVLLVELDFHVPAGTFLGWEPL